MTHNIDVYVQGDLHIHHGATEQQLSAILERLNTMTEASNALNAKIDVLQTTVEAANTKADALLTALAEVRAELKALEESGAGATTAELEAMGARIDATVESLNTQISEDDGGLTPAPPTA